MTISIKNYNLVNLLTKYIGESSIAIEILNMATEMTIYEERTKKIVVRSKQWLIDTENKTVGEKVIVVKYFFNDLINYKDILTLPEYSDLFNLIINRINLFSEFELFNIDDEFMKNLKIIKNW